MGIAVVGLTHHHDAGFVPPARRHFRRLAAVNLLGEILIAAEEHLYVLVEASAAVPSRINHNSILADEFAEKLGIDIAETVVAHGAYMHIAEAST